MKKIVKKLIPNDQLNPINKNIVGIISDLDHPNINYLIKIDLSTNGKTLYGHLVSCYTFYYPNSTHLVTGEPQA